MTVGIALLTRNNAADLPQVIAPLLPYVDQVAILLGGPSSDDTEAVARQHTDRVATYTGPLNEAGGLLDFAQARQESFDLLDTDFALVVDTDDEWLGLENLAEVFAQAEAGQYDGVLFPSDTGRSTFLQTRLFRRDSGRWHSPVHELWRYSAPSNQVRDFATNACRVRQVKDDAGRLASVWRNIAIAEHHLENQVDHRLLMHYSRELTITGQYEKAVAACDRFLDNLHLATELEATPDKLFQILYTKGLAECCLSHFDQAAGLALHALKFAGYGHGWALLAECALQLANYDLVLYAADKALMAPRPVNTIPVPLDNVTYIPYHLKAKALVAMGRPKEAVSALALGLELGGGDDMAALHQNLCREHGIIF